MIKSRKQWVNYSTLRARQPNPVQAATWQCGRIKTDISLSYGTREVARDLLRLREYWFPYPMLGLRSPYKFIRMSLLGSVFSWCKSEETRAGDKAWEGGGWDAVAGAGALPTTSQACSPFFHAQFHLLTHSRILFCFSLLHQFVYIMHFPETSKV